MFTTGKHPECATCGSIMIPQGAGLRCVNCGKLVAKPCKKCGGRGKYVYASTAVWRGGLGGAALTESVCDGCWGSGDEDAPGLNLRRQEAYDREVYRARLRNDPAFRWKERARRFARRARNHRSNYREMVKEVRRLHDQITELEVRTNQRRKPI